MSKLMPIMWVLAVLAGYVSLGCWIVTVRDALRRGVVALGVVALAVSGVALVAPFLLRPVSPVAILAGAAAAYGVLMAFRAFGPPAKPQHVKVRREESRQTYLHLVLLTGAVIFMVPFVWLVSTSLKDDEDIFTNEIRIIPMRPVKVPYQSEMLELVTVEGQPSVGGQMTVRDVTGRADASTVWAQVKDNEDTISVAPLLVGRQIREEAVVKVNPDAIKKVKKTGAVWENYPESLKYLPEETHSGLVYLNNTLIITGLGIVGTLLSASMVAFAFARLRWPGRDALFVVMLATMMLPGAVTMIPTFLIWQKLGFFNTLVPLWAGAFFGGGAFNIFLLRQFFMTIPSELEEAAKIDGCSYWRTYWTIMMPLVRPAMATVAIGTFMGSWNNFMGPLIYISSPTKMPVAYALQLYQSVHGGEFGYLMAASTMVMIPVLLVFFFCQRYFIQGITLTGLKG